MSKLLSPVTVGGLSLKNRVVMSPMCLFDVQAQDGQLTPVHAAHYLPRAIGQVGLIIMESTAVTPYGRITAKDLGLWNDQQASKLTTLVTDVHHLGTKIGVQLNHAGRKAEDAHHLVAPSAIAYDEDWRTPNALTTAEIQTIISEFGAAAKRAQAAGIDVIDVHGAHGYLIDQFLSPETNQRTDQYGGSLKNRYRFLKAVLGSIQANFNGAVWVRLSLSDYVANQNSLSDWQTVGQWLAADGAQLIDASTGGLFPKMRDFPIHDGYQTRFATAMKAAVDLPVSTVGFLDNPGLAEYILQNQQADLIFEGRALMRNPNWVAYADKALHDHDLQDHAYNPSYVRGLKYL